MSLTWSDVDGKGSPSGPGRSGTAGNHTNGTPRRSAYRICLPYFAAVGATSAGMPRDRSSVATRSLVGRSSSVVTATSTALGTLREAATRPAESRRETSRETPTDKPTPGYDVVPSATSASY